MERLSGFSCVTMIANTTTHGSVSPRTRAQAIVMWDELA
jgi:hypothetical protein